MGDAGDMNLGLESIKGFTGKIVQALIGFGGTIIFARYFGPSAFGGFYLLMTAIKIADRPVRGFVRAGQKRYSEHDSDKRQILGGLLIVQLLYLFPLVGGLYVFNEDISRMTGIDSAWIVATVISVGTLSFVSFQNLLSAEGKLGRQVWTDTFRSTLTLPLQLVFVFVGFGTGGMGYGLGIASLITAVYVVYTLEWMPGLPSRDTLVSLWEYAKYSIPTSLIGKAYHRMDVLLLGLIISSPAAVGHYEVALKLTLPATFLYGVIGAGLLSKTSNKSSKGQGVSQDLTNALSYASLIPIPLFFGALALHNRLVVTVYGSEYTPAAILLIGLALFQIFASQSSIYQSVIEGIDKPKLRLRIDAISLVVNIGLGVALLLEFGPVGVVVATISAEFCRLLLSIYSIDRNLDHVDYLPRPIVSQFAAGLIMFTCVMLLKQSIAISNWFLLGVVITSGVLVYGVSLSAISRHFRQTVANAFDSVL